MGVPAAVFRRRRARVIVWRTPSGDDDGLTDKGIEPTPTPTGLGRSTPAVIHLHADSGDARSCGGDPTQGARRHSAGFHQASRRAESCHLLRGNAENVASTMPKLAEAFPDRAIYGMHYRDSSGSSGHPSETALRSDARALCQHVYVRHPDVIAVGRSLGSSRWLS